MDPGPPALHYPTRSKEAALPVERTELGYVQHTHYQQPDLWHEAVVELDSPFAAIFAADTAVFTFLVLGDQNAGKSTFLHAFAYPEDRNFLQLTSILPILTSSFVNSRFLTDSSREPRDELPFLDTDVARGTFLLSLEDFYFFLNENNLPLEPVPSTTRFALVQFIEIGGDHLDRMMHPTDPATSPQVVEIVQRSCELLKGSRRTIYFANCATLFASASLVASSLLTLQSRLAFLNAQLSAGHEVLVYLSRPPSKFYAHASVDVAAKALSLGVEQQQRLAASMSLIDFLRTLLSLMAERGRWHIGIGGVYEARHLQPDQTLDTDVLIEMIAQLFRHRMMGGEQGTEALVATHLLRCHRTLRERVDLDTNELTLWITPQVFAEYLEHLHGCEVPESLLLQQLPLVAHRLAAGGLCIAHESANFSRVIVHFESDSSSHFTWYPAGLQLQQPGASTKPAVVIPTQKRARVLLTEAQIRFPIYAPLYDVIAFYFANNVPATFWLAEKEEDMAARMVFSGALATRLQEVVKTLREVEIAKQWHTLLCCAPDRRAAAASVLVWLLEEWRLGSDLLVASNRGETLLRLSVPHTFLLGELGSLFPLGPPPPCDGRPAVRIRLHCGGPPS